MNTSFADHLNHGPGDAEFDDDTILAAATRIQDAWRGYVSRSNIQLERDLSGSTTTPDIVQGEQAVERWNDVAANVEAKVGP